MRNSKSYRPVNDFEKSSHLFRCRLSKGTAECWAIWEIWLRLSFISSTLWTHWHKSCSLCLGKPGAASCSHAKDCLPSRCEMPCIMLAGRVAAINVEHGKQEVILDGFVVLFSHLQMHRTMEQQKANLVWDRQQRLQQGTSSSRQERVLQTCTYSLPHTEHPLFLLHLLGVRRSYLTYSGVCFPRTKPPLNPRGQERPKEDQRVMWSGS